VSLKDRAQKIAHKKRRTNATVTNGDVTTFLAVLAEAGRLRRENRSDTKIQGRKKQPAQLREEPQHRNTKENFSAHHA